MQRSRSFVRLVWPSLAALLLVANCTVKVEDGDGKGGAANTNGGATSGSGGAPAAGGTVTTQGGSATSSGGNAVANGGAATASGGYAGNAASGGWVAKGGASAAGDTGLGGAGGAGGVAGDVCDDCLATNCPNELEACFDDIRCFNDDPDSPGQYQDMVTCLDAVRVDHPVKRVDVVDCGITVGRSATSNSFAWPPDEMAVTTTDLINCMATGEANKPNNSSWSDGDPDIATDPIAQKWADGSCAKTSCTSKL
jgi:hypothetical protein